MAFIDYYKLLEIDNSATRDQVKKAHRKLAQKYNPTVETLDGKVKLKFLAEIQNRTKVKLKNKGLPLYKKKTNLAI